MLNHHVEAAALPLVKTLQTGLCRHRAPRFNLKHLLLVFVVLGFYSLVWENFLVNDPLLRGSVESPNDRAAALLSWTQHLDFGIYRLL